MVVRRRRPDAVALVSSAAFIASQVRHRHGPTPSRSSGMGLIGMRERVQAHDGVLETGSRGPSERGFRVRFPLAAVAA